MPNAFVILPMPDEAHVDSSVFGHLREEPLPYLGEARLGVLMPIVTIMQDEIEGRLAHLATRPSFGMAASDGLCDSRVFAKFVAQLCCSSTQSKHPHALSVTNLDSAGALGAVNFTSMLPAARGEEWNAQRPPRFLPPLAAYA